MNPKILLLGRTNVGKSTLFNLLTQSRRALVKKEAGTTRDVLEQEWELFGKKYLLIDTGGMYEDRALPEIEQHIRKKNLKLIEQANLILFIVDGRNLLTPSDYLIYGTLRKSGKPFKTIVNKIDSPYLQKENLWHFYELGAEDIIPASFERRHGIDAILEWISSQPLQSLQPLQPLQPLEGGPQKEGMERALASPSHAESFPPVASPFRMVFIGRANVGKSSLCNCLLKEEKALVSPQRGTTHDAVEYPWEKEGLKSNCVLIDTAGVDRKWKTKAKTLVLSGIKSQQSLKQADLVCLILDAMEGPHHQDSKWVQQAVLAHKRILILINKADLLAPEGDSPFLKEKEGVSPKDSLRAKIKEQFHFFPDIPCLFVSAKTGSGLHKIPQKIEEIERKASLKIPTPDLNHFFKGIKGSLPSGAQIYYITQTHHCPPALMIFCNRTEAFSPSCRRFLVNRIKMQWKLQGIPVKLIFMPRK